MNTKAKKSKATMAGVVGLTVAGIAATIVLSNDSAAETADSSVVEQQQSAPVYNYNNTGPRTADAIEGWLKPKTVYTGPRTADAAEAWIESATKYSGPRTADAAEHWRSPRRNGSQP
jgi:hypothetical protein